MKHPLHTRLKLRYFILNLNINVSKRNSKNLKAYDNLKRGIRKRVADNEIETYKIRL